MSFELNQLNWVFLLPSVGDVHHYYVVCKYCKFVLFLFRWQISQIHLMCLSPPFPRSMTSSWGRSTAYFVSSHGRRGTVQCSTWDHPSALWRHESLWLQNVRLSSLILLVPTGLLSLMGNCILLLVAYHKRSTLKPAEFFIINLSISDLGMTLSLFPLAIPSTFSHRYLVGVV